MRKCAKSWESLRKCAKSWESMRKCPKSWESVLKAEIVWESVLKVEKVSCKLRKCPISWETTSACQTSLHSNRARSVTSFLVEPKYLDEPFIHEIFAKLQSVYKPANLFRPTSDLFSSSHFVRWIRFITVISKWN